MDKKTTNVYETTNYRKFKKMLDNREVSPNRVQKIVKSIDQVGYVMSPIIVNEKMEVIDGQGRLAAAERLGLPVYYVVAPGIGIEECRAMNLNQSNWNIKDFVNSYSAGGNINYINLTNLMKEFEKTLGVNTLYAIAYGDVYHSAGGVGERIRSGLLMFDSAEYVSARKLCNYLTEFAPIVNRIGGRKELYFGAIRFMVTCDGCDRKALKERVVKRQTSLLPVANMEQALDMLGDCYNFRCAKKIYFSTEFKKWLDAKIHKQKIEQHKKERMAV